MYFDWEPATKMVRNYTDLEMMEMMIDTNKYVKDENKEYELGHFKKWLEHNAKTYRRLSFPYCEIDGSLTNSGKTHYIDLEWELND